MRTAPGGNPFIRTLILAALLPWVLSLPAHGGTEGYQLLKLDGYKVKWGEKKLGSGASVSYAFADESLRFQEARNCSDLAPMSAISGPELPMETLAHEAEEAFEVWERASGLSFHRIDEPRDADIVLGAQGQPRGRAFANVAYSSQAHESVRAIDQSLVCLNPEHQWKVGFDGNKDVYDIRYTLIHEIGHAIGLDHPGPSGQLMGFQYTEEFAELQRGDLDGVRRLYGAGVDDSEPASRIDTRQAGTVGVGSFLGIGRREAACDTEPQTACDYSRIIGNQCRVASSKSLTCFSASSLDTP